MADLWYSKDHTWVLVEGDRARVGISDFAQGELGDIAYVDLPETGRRLSRGETACILESLKSSSEVYAPVGGVVVEINTLLGSEENCTLVNRDPLGQGWLFALRLEDPKELGLLLREEQYRRYVNGE